MARNIIVIRWVSCVLVKENFKYLLFRIQINSQIDIFCRDVPIRNSSGNYYLYGLIFQKILEALFITLYCSDCLFLHCIHLSLFTRHFSLLSSYTNPSNSTELPTFFENYCVYFWLFFGV